MVRCYLLCVILAVASLLHLCDVALSHGPDQAPPVKELDQAPPVQEERPPTPAPADDPAALPKDYAVAYDRAVKQGKPLVVWTGEAICWPCVRANRHEFVMFAKHSHPAFPDNTLTVGVPVQGTLMMAGQVAEWPDGHIPTVREILRRWQETRATTVRISRAGALTPWGPSTGPSLVPARPLAPALPSLPRGVRPPTPAAPLTPGGPTPPSAPPHHDHLHREVL